MRVFSIESTVGCQPETLQFALPHYVLESEKRKAQLARKAACQVTAPATRGQHPWSCLPGGGSSLSCTRSTCSSLACLCFAVFAVPPIPHESTAAAAHPHPTPIARAPQPHTYRRRPRAPAGTARRRRRRPGCLPPAPALLPAERALEPARSPPPGRRRLLQSPLQAVQGPRAAQAPARRRSQRAAAPASASAPSALWPGPLQGC